MTAREQRLGNETNHLQVITDTLDTVMGLAVEHITGRNTGTIVVEISFLDGGVRTPTIKETRVRKVDSKKQTCLVVAVGEKESPGG